MNIRLILLSIFFFFVTVLTSVTAHANSDLTNISIEISDAFVELEREVLYGQGCIADVAPCTERERGYGPVAEAIKDHIGHLMLERANLRIAEDAASTARDMYIDQNAADMRVLATLENDSATLGMRSDSRAEFYDAIDSLETTLRVELLLYESMSAVAVQANLVPSDLLDSCQSHNGLLQHEVDHTIPALRSELAELRTAESEAAILEETEAHALAIVEPPVPMPPDERELALEEALIERELDVYWLERLAQSMQPAPEVVFVSQTHRDYITEIVACLLTLIMLLLYLRRSFMYYDLLEEHADCSSKERVDAMQSDAELAKKRVQAELVAERKVNSRLEKRLREKEAELNKTSEAAAHREAALERQIAELRRSTSTRPVTPVSNSGLHTRPTRPQRPSGSHSDLRPINPRLVTPAEQPVVRNSTIPGMGFQELSSGTPLPSTFPMVGDAADLGGSDPDIQIVIDDDTE